MSDSKSLFTSLAFIYSVNPRVRLKRGEISYTSIDSEISYLDEEFHTSVFGKPEKYSRYFAFLS